MKKILLIFVILVWGCTKPELPTPQVLSKDKIFSVTESSVTDGQTIFFDLPLDGVYMLTLIDKENEQVVGRERFNGKKGENIKKIYTKNISGKYLYLLLEDNDKRELGKTTIITK